MNDSLFLGLVHNISLLLASALLFDSIAGRRQTKQARFWQTAIGFLLGVIGIILMLTPWVYSPGIIFDTRSVLLGISGIFFGTIPTLIAMCMTAAYRIYQGGAATWMGVSVILATGTIGILWARFLRKPLDAITGWQLYIFGLVIHAVMLACAFVLPLETALQVLSNISLPVITIYPLGTLLLGLLMVNRLRRERNTIDLKRADARLKSLVEILQRPVESVQEFLDFALDQAIVLTESKIGYIFFYSEEHQQLTLNSISKNAMVECAIPDFPTCYELSETGLWGEAVRQRKAIILNNYPSDNLLKKGYPPGHVQITKFMTIPVFKGKQIVVVVGVANKDTDYVEADVLQLTLMMDGVWKATERKQAEEALHETDERYHQIMDTAQEGIWIIDAAQHTIYLNPRMAAMLGYSPDEIIGKSIQDFMFTEDLADHSMHMQERQHGQSGQYERRFRMKDGREIWTNVSGSPLKDDQDKFAGSFGMFTDITQRKRTEGMLQARLTLLQFAATHSLKELFQETLDTIGGLVISPVGLFYTLEGDQKTFTLQAWSPHAIETECKDFRYAVDEMEVWVNSIRDRFPLIFNDKDTLPGHLGLPAGQTKIFREVVVPVFRGSVIVGILELANKSTDYGKEDVELASTLVDLAWDIVEQKRAEETLRQSNETAQAILNAATESVFLMNIEGQVIAANQTTATRLGKDLDSLIGANMYEILPPEVAASRKEQLGIVFSAHHPVHFEDERFGAWIENNIYPIFEADGQVSRVAIYGRDITERKLAEASIQQAQAELRRLLIESDQSRRALLSVVQDQKRTEEKIRQLNLELEQRVKERTVQLEASNKELEAFAYSVSHDLRTPLRALDGFSGILLSDYQNQLDEQGKHYLERIQEASRRMGHLIEDLLNLSRITRREMYFEQINLSSIAQQIANELQAQTAQRTVEFDITPDLMVQADPNLMKIAVENLLSNAIKFSGTRDQAHIQIGVIEKSGKRVFFVMDNGVGFNMAYANKLFIPFQRLHGMQEFPGTGIGLVTVQRIIARHGGRLWAEAEVDKGATFYFTLGDERLI